MRYARDSRSAERRIMKKALFSALDIVRIVRTQISIIPGRRFVYFVRPSARNFTVRREDKSEHLLVMIAFCIRAVQARNFSQMPAATALMPKMVKSAMPLDDETAPFKLISVPYGTR